ncbi:restriction endonuclease subunit S [Agrococcus sp. 1P02AA]|uniref:restriction endonuclease subunit S n=1 Tax=Agrococcus sp. 1P02AA TaxID=3132259 RepID=UPI0039A729EE
MTWHSVTLGDICRFKAGTAFPKTEQGNRRGALGFAKVSDLGSDDQRDLRPPKHWLTSEQLERMRVTRAPGGSSLFAKIGEGLKSERVRYVREDITFDNNLMAALPIRDRVVPEFLYYLLRTVRLSEIAVGSALPYIKQTDLAAVATQVPALPAQHAIAEVLGALDDKLAANAKLIAAADRLATAKTRAALYPSTHKPLSELAAVTMGSSPSGESLNEDGDGTVFYQGVRDFGIRTPTPRVWTKSVTRWAQAGDTLLSVRAPVGRVNIAHDAVCIGRGLASIRTTTSTPWTLFNVLKVHPELWAPFDAEGTIFSSINRSGLEGLAVPIVRPSIAADLEAELATIESLIASLDRESTRLGSLRDALLPELMSGRLRVKDAERAVEEAV